MRRRIARFSKKDIEEALLTHADSLVSDGNNSDELLARYPQFGQVLEGLFGLAKRVRNALTPVDPADTFVAELRTKLAKMRDNQSMHADRRREIRKMVWQIAGVAGLMLSGVAMLALGVRLIIGLLSRRATTPI